jgi:hypothetical protein
MVLANHDSGTLKATDCSGKYSKYGRQIASLKSCNESWGHAIAPRQQRLDLHGVIGVYRQASDGSLTKSICLDVLDGFARDQDHQRVEDVGVHPTKISNRCMTL